MLRLEAARLDVAMVVSLWNLTGTSAAALPRYLPNFRAIGKVWTRISRLRDFTRSCGKTSYRLVNRGPEVCSNEDVCWELTGSSEVNMMNWRQFITWTSDDQSWWRHQMETFFSLLALCAGNFPVTGKFPAQRPVTRSFDAFFDLRLNKRLGKQSWGRWFETPSFPLRRHCNVSFSTHNFINRINKTFTAESPTRRALFNEINLAIFRLYFNGMLLKPVTDMVTSVRSFELKPHVFYTLQWRHQSVMPSQIIVNSNICSMACSD